MTPEDIIKKMCDIMPFNLADEFKPYIEEAMHIYADQEAKAYAHWIANQVIAGRTSHKLFHDYKKEIA